MKLGCGHEVEAKLIEIIQYLINEEIVQVV